MIPGQTYTATGFEDWKLFVDREGEFYRLLNTRTLEYRVFSHYFLVQRFLNEKGVRATEFVMGIPDFPQ